MLAGMVHQKTMMLKETGSLEPENIMKPIVFISSVFKGYEKVRQTAIKAIAIAGGQPLGFEDLSALDKSPRNACLDGVRNCDVYLGILGQFFGTKVPSGKSVTEEEFEEAVRLGKKRLIFIENVSTFDPDQHTFIAKIGNYQSGRFWKRFNNVADLESEIITSLRKIFAMNSHSLSSEDIQEILSSEIEKGLENNHDQTWLATVAFPADVCELARDAEFYADKIARELFMAGIDIDPPVFEIESAKQKIMDRDCWKLSQLEPMHRHREGCKLSSVRVYQKGLIFVAMNVTGRGPKENHGSDMYVEPNIVKPVASTQLQFISNVYDMFDKHIRWDRIALLSALYSVGHRTYGSPKPGQTSYTMRMSDSDKPIIAFDSFKQLERIQLKQVEYLEDLISAFKRRIK